MCVWQSLLLCSLAVCSCVVAARALYIQGGGALKAPYLPEGTPTPEAKWIDQKLDHFSGKTSTWKQRYFVNSTWWDKKSGPVFFLLGGEGPSNPAWIVANTNIMINAQKYKALVFSIEHRYYGESHPTKDASTANLRFLSSRQALADFSYFRDVMVRMHNMTDQNKWVSFGGSYSGALSAWLRQLYPKAVVGAVASSAPVLAKLDYVEYIEVVEASLETGSSSCPSNVATAAAYVASMLKDKKNWKEMEKIYNVKPSLSGEQDAVQMLTNLAGNFEGIVQYNKDNTCFEGRPNNITISDLCDIMDNKTLGIPLLRYAAVNKLVGDGDTLDCSYKKMIDDLKKTSWKDDSTKEGGRQWTYQTCTEFGYFQTTDSKQSSLFSDTTPLSYFTDICTEVFGIKSEDVSSAVEHTNTFYGGRNVTGTNIVFPNGSIDPWHALSIVQDIGPTVKALLIQGTAHCANMYPPRDSDLEGLTEARTTISKLLGQWLADN